MKICLLTSAHTRSDIRIFQKECLSLSKHFNVSLIVADGLGDSIVENINIFDVGKPSSRRERMRHTTKLIYKKAIELDLDSYHFHDPELLTIGRKLKRIGKIVIYDAHEDLPRQIMGKPYLNKISKIILSIFFEKYENRIVKKLDYIITATPFIRNRFLKINKNVIDINNYPIIDELNQNIKWEDKKDTVTYIGGISDIRGIRDLIKAFEFSKYKLNLIGNFFDENLKAEVEKYEGWKNINFYGYLSRADMAELLSSSKAGIVTFLPLPNHINAQPNKIFEYMSAGIPVIASHFDLWKEIIEKNNCGICVDPQSPKEIANAINKIVGDNKLANTMGENGIKAVYEVYNWKIEENKLIDIYNSLKTNI